VFKLDFKNQDYFTLLTTCLTARQAIYLLVSFSLTYGERGKVFPDENREKPGEGKYRIMTPFFSLLN
jgi:hypothetical protein